MKLKFGALLGSGVLLAASLRDAGNASSDTLRDLCKSAAEFGAFCFAYCFPAFKSRPGYLVQFYPHLG